MSFSTQVIFIEGNIGVGKSTILTHLQQLGYRVLYEPVDPALLEKYYAKEIAAYDFQAGLNKLRGQVEMELALGPRKYETFKDSLVFVERSMWTGLVVFGKYSLTKSEINQQEYDELARQYTEHLRQREAESARTGVLFWSLYLKAPSSILASRIKSRGRACEQTISIEYLNQLELLYVDWFRTEIEKWKTRVIRTAIWAEGEESETSVDYVQRELIPDIVLTVTRACIGGRTNRTRFICLSGNIGAGKSSLVEELKTRFATDNTIRFAKEPVDEWSSTMMENGKSLFENYYSDPKEWAFKFQVNALASRIESMLAAVGEGAQIVICERSPIQDRDIFAKYQMEKGYMSRDEYDLLTRYAETAFKALPYPHEWFTVLVDSCVDTCARRVRQRGRAGEEGVANILPDLARFHRECTADYVFDGSLEAGTADYRAAIDSLVQYIVSVW